MHEDIGLNFASTLRSFLRQDPDIIMVGEIRDFETAEIAIKAALTGHLVLSTLHTNDAPATVSRLLNMGVEPFLVASAVNLICAQRLLRTLCKDCKEPIDIPEQQLIDLQAIPEHLPDYQVHHGVGCRTCNSTGHKGRLGVYEIMEMTDELGEFVLNGASTLELKREAIRQGMNTLRMSALKKLATGMTSIKEVAQARVIKKRYSELSRIFRRFMERTPCRHLLMKVELQMDKSKKVRLMLLMPMLHAIN